MLNPDQYASATKYRARILLYNNFRTNPASKSTWLFGFFPDREGLKVLELGCGTGIFWLENHASIPASWEITLSDYSEGMLEETRGALSRLARPFSYEVVDAAGIGYPDASFDVVLANNMLYHIDDRKRALFHIVRILRDDGRLLATARGRNDMRELNELLYAYLRGKSAFRFGESKFSTDNGLDQLAHYFPKVDARRFENSLEITEVDQVVDYFLSYNGMTEGLVVLPEEGKAGFAEFLRARIGPDRPFHVTKEEGAFICESAPRGYGEA